jgi:hypothetical protein
MGAIHCMRRRGPESSEAWRLYECLAKGRRCDGPGQGWAQSIAFGGGVQVLTSHGGRTSLCTLIEAGADATAQDKDGRSPLHEAAGSSSSQAMEVVRALIEAGADATAQDKDGCTPLDEALSKGHEGVARLLRRHGTISP